jgi:hypothetical protein
MKMTAIKQSRLVLLAAALITASANGAVSVSFDATDSNIGAGLYDFTLAGAPANAVFADFNSAFTLTGWAAVGNSIVLVSTVAPSAWNLTQNDSNNAKWILESYTGPNNVVDGRFEVRGTPNLQGSLLWQFAWPADNTYSTSGNVIISAVPESEGYGPLAAAALFALGSVSWWRQRNRMKIVSGCNPIRTMGAAVLAGVFACATMDAPAAVTFSGSSTFGGTGISASATFDTDGTGDLLVTLVNTFTGDTPDQSHVLTALFFDGANGLTPVQNSAIAPVGSTEWNKGSKVSLEGPPILGQQWEYLSGISGAPGSATAGISSSGFGIFGFGNFASNGNMVDGSPYGILSAGYNGSTLDGLKTQGPFIQNSMTFELSGFNGNLNSISDVAFQYGTALPGQPNAGPSLVGTPLIVGVPEPSYALASWTMLLPAVGLRLLLKSPSVH